ASTSTKPSHRLVRNPRERRHPHYRCMKVDSIATSHEFDHHTSANGETRNRVNTVHLSCGFTTARLISQYFGIDPRLTTATILVRPIPKSRRYHRAIVSFTRFWCYRLVASDFVGAASRSSSARTCCTDQPRPKTRLF